jgi:hypothetical protein
VSILGRSKNIAGQKHCRWSKTLQVKNIAGQKHCRSKTLPVKNIAGQKHCH